MSVPWTRALQRTPLITAIVAGSIVFGGVAAARVTNEVDPPFRARFARVADTVQANAPPARALGLTTAYFKALGIAAREAPPEQPAPPPATECDSHASSRLAKRAAPAPSNPPADSSHLASARRPRELSSSAAYHEPPTIAFPSE